jgi:NAD(P)-dependent dehydrogenase (short-subunit alcohol dehydrogenase family)
MGLGLAAAKELASRGANLTLVDYNEKSLLEAKDEISKQFPGNKIITVVADVSKEDAVKNYVDEAVKTFGRIDGLYNNAGIEGKQASITEYDVNIFKKVIDINLMGVYYAMRYVIPAMQKQNYGRIVNVASVGGIRGVLNQMPYVCVQVSCHCDESRSLDGRRGATFTIKPVACCVVLRGNVVNDATGGSVRAERIVKRL